MWQWLNRLSNMIFNYYIKTPKRTMTVSLQVQVHSEYNPSFLLNRSFQEESILSNTQPLNDKQYNNLKLVAYILTAIGVISLPVDFPFHLIIGAVVVVIGAVGSGVINYLTKPDTVTVVNDSSNIAKALVEAIQTIKAEQASPTPQVPTPVDTAVVIAAMQTAANQAIEAYKAQVAAEAAKPVAPVV